MFAFPRKGTVRPSEMSWSGSCGVKPRTQMSSSLMQHPFNPRAVTPSQSQNLQNLDSKHSCKTRELRGDKKKKTRVGLYRHLDRDSRASLGPEDTSVWTQLPTPTALTSHLAFPSGYPQPCFCCCLSPRDFKRQGKIPQSSSLDRSRQTHNYSFVDNS